MANPPDPVFVLDETTQSGPIPNAEAIQKQTHYISTRKGLNTAEIFKIAIGAYSAIELGKLISDNYAEIRNQDILQVIRILAQSSINTVANITTVAVLLDRLGAKYGADIDDKLETDGLPNSDIKWKSGVNAYSVAGMRGGIVSGAVLATIPVQLGLMVVLPVVGSAFFRPQATAMNAYRENGFNLAMSVVLGLSVAIGSISVDQGTTITREE